MNFKEFINRANIAINDNKKDKVLLNNENKFLRANFILQLLKNLSKYLEFFDFKNNIIFIRNDAFIIIDGIKFKLDHFFYLKKSGIPQVSEILNTLRFIDKYDITPNYIIDLGACWGEYSLFLANEFPNAKIFSIEGAVKNYLLFKTNLQENQSISKLIYPSNLIMSDHIGEEQITNEISTMNVVKKHSLNSDNLIMVESTTLKEFCKNNNIDKIDFIKIDIEGSEIKLLDDLLNLNIKSIQIEIINYNSISVNIHFLQALSKNYNFVNFNSLEIESINDIIDITKNTLNKKSTIDLFLIKK